MERGEHEASQAWSVLRGRVAKRPEQRGEHDFHNFVQRVARGHPDRTGQAREQ